MQVKIPIQNLKIDPEPAAKLFCHILEKAELAALGSLNRVTKALYCPVLTCPYHSLTYLCMEALLLGLFLTNHCVWNSGRESYRKND